MDVMLNAAVRIIPPSEVCDSWLAEDVLERRRYKLSPEAAAVLVAACHRVDREELAKRVSANDGHRRAPGYWARTADSLYRHRLIVDASTVDSDARVAWLRRLRKDWSRYGWHEAVEYHALTFDYPCMDYSVAAKAVEEDRALMRSFQSREPDTDRMKLDYLDRPAVPLPEPASDLRTGTLPTVWAGAEAGELDADALATVLSLTFGRTGTWRLRTNAAPLILRTSPSGGGRHPSEGYVVVHDVPGLDAGWYHVTMQPFGLRRLDIPPPDAGGLARTFQETVPRFPFPLRALVVLTSVFERNMYRYREPRTFRTVHMDAGHLAATARMTAVSLGLTAHVFYCDDPEMIEKALGLDGTREGYMLTVALADGPAAS
jgi:SagB-type dehydrogenase family enzyme